MNIFVGSVSGLHYKVNIFYNCLIDLFIFPHITSKQLTSFHVIITMQTFEMGAILSSFLGS